MALGLVGLLIPVLVAPVLSDSRYHYPASLSRFESLWDTVPWTIDDMGWRLESGRIAPFGVWYQAVTYYLVMKLCLLLGIDVWMGEALLKLALIAAAVVAFRALLGQLRSASGERLALPARRLGTVLFAAIVVLGATTTSPNRNGWTTFVQLCIGGCAILFGFGALALWALNGWSRWARWKKGGVALLLVVSGALLVISYELHWAAYPFAVVLVLAHRRGTWRLHPVEGDRARVAVIAWVSLGFLTCLAVTRVLIAKYTIYEYPGLVTDLHGPVARTVLLQLVNAVPGTGGGRVLEDVAAIGGLGAPRAGVAPGWVSGLALAVGLLLVSARLRPGAADGGAAAAAERDSQASWADWTTALLALAGASLLSAVVGALLLSVSVQSQELVSEIGATYRGTPWIWMSLSAAASALLVVLVGRTRPGRAWVVVPAVGALLVGGFVWPDNVDAQRAIRQSRWAYPIEEITHQLVTGSQAPEAEQVRCNLDAELAKYGTYFAFVNASRDAFRDAWQRDLCSTRLMPPPKPPRPRKPLPSSGATSQDPGTSPGPWTRGGRAA